MQILDMAPSPIFINYATPVPLSSKPPVQANSDLPGATSDKGDPNAFCERRFEGLLGTHRRPFYATSEYMFYIDTKHWGRLDSNCRELQPSKSIPIIFPALTGKMFGDDSKELLAERLL